MTPERQYWMSFANGFHYGLTEMYDILTKKRCLPDQAMKEALKGLTPRAQDPGWYDGFIHGMRLYYEDLMIHHRGMRASYKAIDTYWETVLVPWVQAKLPPMNTQVPTNSYPPPGYIPPPAPRPYPSISPKRPANTVRIVIAAMLAAIAIFCTISTALLVQGDRLTRALSIIAATNTVPTDTPTYIPPTAIPYLGIGDTPILGGTFAGFRAKYGGPSGPDSFEILSDLHVVATLSYKVGLDGHNHINRIDMTPSGKWTTAQANRAILLLLPTDTTHIRDSPLGKLTTEHIDQSAQLAATFPAALFTDIDNKPQPPGTFSYACDVGTLADGCTLSIQI